MTSKTVPGTARLPNRPKGRRREAESLSFPEALWDYRTTIGEVLFSSPLSEIYRTATWIDICADTVCLNRSCEGSGRLAHITTDRGGVAWGPALLADSLDFARFPW